MRTKLPARAKLLRSGKVSSKSTTADKKGYNTTNTESEEPEVIDTNTPLYTNMTTGISQVIQIFESATEEVCEILSKECSIILECNVCCNMFRSVANLLSHKQKYCSTKYVDMKTSNTQDLDYGRGNTLSSRTTTGHDVITLLENLFVGETKIDQNGMTSENATVVNEIKSNSSALFKRNHESLEDSGCEKDIEGIPDFAIAGPSGHTKTVSPPVHIMKTCFVCPCCKKYLASSWSVHRHLHKDHRKTTEQVRKLRPLIQKKQVSSADMGFSETPPLKLAKEEPDNLDRAWMKELEDNIELQRCLGCGRRFERRVALLSHNASCQKRAIVLQKKRTSTTKLDTAKKTGIQVSMSYKKPCDKPVSNEPSLHQSVLTASSLFSDTSITSPSSSHSGAQLSDSDTSNIVCRYRKDLELPETCRRSEASLLQLHNVAVEEVEGSLTDCLVPASPNSILDCIGSAIQSYSCISYSLME